MFAKYPIRSQTACYSTLSNPASMTKLSKLSAKCHQTPMSMEFSMRKCQKFATLPLTILTSSLLCFGQIHSPICRRSKSTMTVTPNPSSFASAATSIRSVSFWQRPSDIRDTWHGISQLYLTQCLPYACGPMAEPHDSRTIVDLHLGCSM